MTKINSEKRKNVAVMKKTRLVGLTPELGLHVIRFSRLSLWFQFLFVLFITFVFMYIHHAIKPDGKKVNVS